ncbi:MAG TPA: CoA-binding protein [Anaerolineales bacterium]|nr:CoA-binding protein [Anaerolineales bacterium]
MNDDTLRTLLNSTTTIAVVGLSADAARPSHGVARYLRDQGYRIIPVNPTVEEVLGEKAYPNLDAVPVPVDVVDVFRLPNAVPEIVEAAIRIGAKAVWMQEGIAHPEAARRAEDAGLIAVQNRCMMKEHFRLVGPKFD